MKLPNIYDTFWEFISNNKGPHSSGEKKQIKQFLILVQAMFLDKSVINLAP